MADAASQASARLRMLRARAQSVAPRAALNAITATVVAGVQQELAQSSHRKGTPTPSQPGNPPSWVSGTLARSIRFTPPVMAGPGRWTASVGGTVIYARIQELGGDTGRGGATHLPARPYLRPTADRLRTSGVLTRVEAKAFVAALTG